MPLERIRYLGTYVTNKRIYEVIDVNGDLQVDVKYRDSYLGTIDFDGDITQSISAIEELTGEDYEVSMTLMMMEEI
jgi:hypothetical protein